jgi:hypothetical protein
VGESERFTVKPLIISYIGIDAMHRLTDDYKLTPSEVAEVLGTAAEYKVSEAADRNAGVVLKIKKERLQSLTPVK